MIELPPNHALQPDPPVRAFFLANVGGGGPVNSVLLAASFGIATGSRRSMCTITRTH